ncbi:hypothetical protein F4808DRAFT_429471 [Astrocystis sublimbata]|nr:hypothetical protein F4808DRAFT_429471 [Astrocystis sublimbata]
MVSDNQPSEGVGLSIVTDIEAIISTRLRNGQAPDLDRLKNAISLLDLPSDSNTIRLLRQTYLQDLKKKRNATLRSLRSELRITLDQLFNKLEADLDEAADQSISPSILVSTAQSEMTMPPTAANSSDPKPAPASSKPLTTTPTADGVRSVISTKNTAMMGESGQTSTAFKAVNSEALQKRALDPEQSVTAPVSKKTKTAQTGSKTSSSELRPKSSKHFADVKEDECIFRYENFTGLYILRCNNAKCKRTLKQDGPVIFTSHPFRNGLALDHFDGQPHNIDSEEVVFRRFAFRIVDAANERNTEERLDIDLIFDSSCSDSDMSSIPARPNKSKDKGKRPDTQYDLQSPHAAEASSSNSASTKTSETFRQSFYRAGHDPSIPDPTVPSGDSAESLTVTSITTLIGKPKAARTSVGVEN